MKYLFLFALIVATLICYSSAERPAHCYEAHPVGVGPCRMIIFGYYFNSASNKCEEYQEGGCSATAGRTYKSLEECNADCVETA